MTKNLKKELINLKNSLSKKLDAVYHRGNSSGFFLGKPINELTSYCENQAIQKKFMWAKF